MMRKLEIKINKKKEKKKENVTGFTLNLINTIQLI